MDFELLFCDFCCHTEFSHIFLKNSTDEKFIRVQAFRACHAQGYFQGAE